MITVLAQATNFSINSLTDPVAAKFPNIGSVISSAIPFVFAFAGVGLLLMIVASGMTLLTSAGDPKKMEQGKQRLTYAIVGFLIIFAAYWLVQILGIIFGFEGFKTIFQ